MSKYAKQIGAMFTGGGQKGAVKQGIEQARLQQEQQVNLARQQQDAQGNAAGTEQQLGRVRRTPRGRRALLGETGSKLG